MALPISLIALIFGLRQAEPRELVAARQPHGIVMERIERREQPRPDRRRARGRKLLAADDGAEPGIAALAAAQRRHAGFGEHRLPARVLLDEDADGCFQIGLGVNDVRHALGFVAKPSAMPQPVFRFAPSPNGYLHLGHALSALLNFDMARAAGGRFLLRIEDIDATRCRPEFEAAIYEDLAWLGLSWEQPVRRQSEHFDDYRAALGKLEAMRLTFPSFESRAEIAHMVGDRDVRERWPRDPDGVPLYPGAARQMKEQDRQARIARGEPYAIRLDMEKAMEWAGAAALERNRRRPGRRDAATSPPTPPPGATSSSAARRRRPAITSSVVIDDALQGVTDVVRGQDLFWSTSVHRLLQALLGLPAPAYHHHRLILDADGKKLSKSTQATGLRELRAQGMTPADIRRLVNVAV